MALSYGHTLRLAETYLADLLDRGIGAVGHEDYHPSAEQLAAWIVHKADAVKVTTGSVLVLRFDMDREQEPANPPADDDVYPQQHDKF